MINDPSLLVVDDEEAICEGCRRIFSRQGFRVEKSSDSQQGLNLAEKNDYAAILLDIKMPKLDGIEFLRKLRVKRPEVPVILITGYPSVANAASAIRLGASDYVTKPFTPEEITQSVQRLLAGRGAKNSGAAASVAAGPAAAAGKFRFLDESWFKRGDSGPLRVGAMLTPSEGAKVEGIRLPQLSEAVYQGLPLAGLKIEGKWQRTIPSPLSGVVVAVNPQLQQNASALWDDPFGSGWIARISPTHFEAEAQKCSRRRVILAGADDVSAGRQCDRLASLGCAVRTVGDWEGLAPMLADPDCRVVVIDAASFGSRGPELAERVNAAAPAVKLVVVASSASPWEAAYREHKIFYYAVEPLADDEMVEILDALFRPRKQPGAQPSPRKPASDFISSIVITNRNGKKVCLLAANGSLSKEEGVGKQIRRRLVERLFPVRTTFEKGSITHMKVMVAASKCDHLFVLLPKDTGRLSGSLTRDSRGEFVSGWGEEASKMTALIVQPDSSADGLAGLDERTASALADYVAGEMASC